MLIKYTGSKTVKTVEHNNLSFTFIDEAGGKTPVCEIKDVVTLKFLLGADMKGLFVPATPNTPGDDKASKGEAEASRKASEKLSKTVKELTEENKALEKANDTLEDENKGLVKKVKELEKKLKDKK